MEQRPEAVIRLHTYEPCIITTDEYLAIQQELITRALVDQPSPGDKILAKLMLEHHSRYVECVLINRGPLKEHDVVKVKFTGALGTIVDVQNERYAVEYAVTGEVSDDYFSEDQLERA